ncbi:putative glycine N-acyltransferase-like protein 1B [Vombatus ursinus]|uniref:putative glycine N-acyltransferase-like protein 1B n=1 Tax=Vombatus ursinus TaxID=29139 RepID=UPI000FFDBEF1|nr:putative glycine N-acyltransferase-like protein 1B [Vombatus ursinus]
MHLVCEDHIMQALYQLLAQSIPESLKVYGAIFHIIHGNPFNLEVLVDSWPDYQTVVTRPKKQEMVDKLDRYTNTYYIFTKDLQKCQQFLESTEVIDWKQVIQIQGCQESLDKRLRKIAASKFLQVEHLSNVLFVKEEILQLGTTEGKLVTTVPDTKVFERNLELTFARLNASHAKLVNDHWELGLNEKSLNYVIRCIQNLPTFCLLDSEGNPISWVVMDQTGELRMACTLPQYRAKGIGHYLKVNTLQYLFKENIPFFLHIAEKKKYLFRGLIQSGFHSYPHGWNQWTLTPKMKSQY